MANIDISVVGLLMVQFVGICVFALSRPRLSRALFDSPLFNGLFSCSITQRNHIIAALRIAGWSLILTSFVLYVQYWGGILGGVYWFALVTLFSALISFFVTFRLKQV